MAGYSTRSTSSAANCSSEKNYFEWKQYKNFVEWRKERNGACRQGALESQSSSWEKVDYLSKHPSMSGTTPGEPSDPADLLTWYVKVVVTRSKECDVYVTNLVEVWLEELTFEDFDTKLKVLNPNLEGGNARNFIEIVKSLIVGSQESKISIDRDHESESYLKIQYKSTYSGVPFFWEFDGAKASVGEAKKMIIDPLLIMLSQYQRREKELMEFLMKKDREIDCYSGKVFRKNMETPKFVPQSWNANYENSESFFDVCREFRCETLHPFQDSRFRSMCASVDDALDFFDFVQSEDDRRANAIKVEEESDESETAESQPSHSSSAPHGHVTLLKRKVPPPQFIDEGDDDDVINKEPDSSSGTALTLADSSRPTTTKKRQILRL